MRGNDDVIELMVLDKGVAGMHQLDPRDDREGAADHSGDDGEGQVKGADILVVGRAQPAGKKTGGVAVTVGSMAMLIGGVGVVLVSHLRSLDLNYPPARSGGHPAPRAPRP